MNRRGFFGVVAGAVAMLAGRAATGASSRGKFVGRVALPEEFHGISQMEPIGDLPPYLRDFRAGPWHGGARSIIYFGVQPGYRLPVQYTEQSAFDWRERMFLIHARTRDGRLHTVMSHSFADQDSDIGFGLTVERRTGDLVCVRAHPEPTDRIWISASAQFPRLGGGGTGTKIQKVEIVVKGHEDPSRVARLVQREIGKLGRKPPPPDDVA